MDDTEKRDAGFSDHGGLSEWWIPGLLAMGLICVIGWPAYRGVAQTGGRALTRPFFRLIHPEPVRSDWSAPQRSAESALARKARSMEFRTQKFRVNPSVVSEWCEEWNCAPVERLLLLRLLVQQLPEAAAWSGGLPQHGDLNRTILDLSAAEIRSQPENGFYWLAESLALFYSGKEPDAIQAIRQARQCRRFDAGLKELNRAEYSLWKAETRPWLLLPPTPRNWGLDLERPLYALSRNLSQQERIMLRRYNLEKAVELGMLHLGLAAQLMEAAWTPADVSLAHAIAHHAMDAFTERRGAAPAASPAETGFLHFLEEHADKLDAMKARAWLSEMADRQSRQAGNLSIWRRIQALSSWNASAVLACLFLQSFSLFLVWCTLAVFSLTSAPEKRGNSSASLLFAPRRCGVAGLTFAVAPFALTFSKWPAGGAYLFSSLVLGWMLWWGVMAIGSPRPSLVAVRKSVAQGLLLLLTATLLTTGAVSLVLQQRQQRLGMIAEQGW
ncbi:MAG: hypothetical protein HY360_14295 [Verrucomicrobia bacterium]|nr:hypothetical protein [Verrucomicrobiota bacterium]